MVSADIMSTPNAMSETKKSIKVLDELFQKLNVATDESGRHYAADNLASFINGPIEEQEYGISKLIFPFLISQRTY